MGPSHHFLKKWGPIYLTRTAQKTKGFLTNPGKNKRVSPYKNVYIRPPVPPLWRSYKGGQGPYSFSYKEIKVYTPLGYYNFAVARENFNLHVLQKDLLVFLKVVQN